MNPIYEEILIYKYKYFFSNDKALKNANALNFNFYNIYLKINFFLNKNDLIYKL